MKRALFAALVIFSLAACTSAQTTTTVAPRTYTYSCCPNGETTGVWHAGERRTLAWKATPADGTTSASPIFVIIRTRLTGPFPTVAALKDAIGAAKLNTASRTIDGTPLRIGNDTADGVVSVIQLPGDLPTGLYNLDLTTDYGGGNRAGGAAIIQVN